MTCPDQQDDSVGGEMYEVSSSAYINFNPDTPSGAPLIHDYINSKGLLYMEDVTNFALQLARGLKHLEDHKVIILKYDNSPVVQERQLVT